MAGIEVQRLFFALWPEEVVRRGLADLQRQVTVDRARAVAVANLHATLVFLGACDAAQRLCAEGVAERSVGRRFDLAVDQYGFWRRPQVLWAGSAQTPPTLFDLVAQLRAGLAGCGFTVETRPFETHITLFRKVRKMPLVPNISASPLSWPVRSFALVTSVTDPAGARYQVLREWRLA